MGQYEDSPLASVASRLGEAFRDLGFGEDGIAGALGFRCVCGVVTW